MRSMEGVKLEMKVIICIDDNGGMLFNSRRQSRDRVLIADIMNGLGDKRIYISSFSRLLFEGYEGRYIIKDDVPNGLCRDDVCFIENVDINPYIKEINSITLYRWNRVYPRDFSFDTGNLANGFTMRETCDFEGYSHEKITKEVFER